MTEYEAAIREELAERERDEWDDYLQENSDKLAEAQDKAVEAVDALFYGFVETMDDVDDDDVDEIIDEEPELEMAYEMTKNMIAGQYSRRNLLEEAGDEYAMTADEKKQEIAAQLGADPQALEHLGVDELATYEKATEEVEQLVEIAEDEGLDKATDEETIREVRRDVYGSPDGLREVYNKQKQRTAEMFEQFGTALAAQESGTEAEAVAASIEGFGEKFLESFETLVDPKIEREVQRLYGEE